VKSQRGSGGGVGGGVRSPNIESNSGKKQGSLGGRRGRGSCKVRFRGGVRGFAGGRARGEG